MENISLKQAGIDARGGMERAKKETRINWKWNGWSSSD